MITYRQPFTGDYPISQKYGETITSDFHTGIDYACPVNTPILASADGIVMKAGWDSTGYGNMVIILHSAHSATLYAHLSECAVYDNQRVKQGDVIGWSGYSGNVIPEGIRGAHLHFEARDRWNDPKSHKDPMTLPLMTFAAPPNTERNLKNADQFAEGDTVEIVAPMGAKAFYTGFGDRTVYGKGARFYYTGKTEDRNGYTYMQVIPLSAPVWIAVHDNDCQILDKAGQ